MYHYMHIDDLKISHAEKNVVEFVLKDLRNKFRKESPLVNSHRKVLEYLGMTIERTSKGNARLFVGYVKKSRGIAP